MKKQFTLFRMVFLLCAMILGGVSPALAEEETIASFTASGANSGNLNGWTINGSPSYSTSGGGFYQLTNSDISIVTPSIKWSDYSDITITISARKYGGPNATQGKISVSQGSTELTSYSPSGTSIAASSALKISPNDGTITISCPGASSSKGCGVQSIVIKGTKKASTSPLDFITLSGTYPTSFTEGDEFSHEGMTVTATYEDESTADVTSSASFTGYDMTVLGQNQTVTVSYSEGEVTRTAEYTIIVNALPKHSVTWSVNGTESEPESYKEGAAITFPANPADIEGKSFVGWTETAISGTTDEKPTFVTSATMGEADVTYYAVFAEIEGEPGWTETALSDIEDTDIFVFSNGSYAMSNDNGASAAPAAVAITVKDGKITSVVADNLKWNVSGNATGGYTFYPNGSTTTWMYCNTTASSSSNNNIRIGTGNRKLWIFDGDNYLVTNDNNTKRYLSIYNDQDFRGYINTDLAFVPKFYKYSEGSYSGYCTTVAADTREEAGLSFAESTATVEWYVADQYTGQNLTNPNNVSPITWTSSNEGVATVENGTVTVLALGTTTITASFAGNDAYKPGSASFTLQVVDTRSDATVEFRDANNEPITELNIQKGEVAQGITPYCSVEGFTFTQNDMVPSWEGETMPAAYDLQSNSVTSIAVGTMTYTATFLGDETYKPASATLTINVTEVPATYTLAYSITPGRHYIIASGTDENVYAIGGQNNNNRKAEEVTANNGVITVTNNVAEFLIEVDDKGYFTIKDEDTNNTGYLYAASSSSNHLKTQTTNDNKGEWKIEIDENGVATIKANKTGGHNLMRYNSGSGCFSCYDSGQDDIYLFEKNGDEGTQEFTVSIAEACTDGEGKYYGTFSAPFACTVPSDVTVSEIAVVNGVMAIGAYEAGAVIPANTGVMISSATSGTKTFTSAKGGMSVLANNCLRPTFWGITAEEMASADESCVYYRLTMHNGTTIGFWWGADGGDSFAIVANKAYLAVPTSVAGARNGFAFGDDSTTGISNVNVNENVNGSIFDLQGRKVSTPGKGLYIVNGKKVVIK